MLVHSLQETEHNSYLFGSAHVEVINTNTNIAYCAVYNLLSNNILQIMSPTNNNIAL